MRWLTFGKMCIEHMVVFLVFLLFTGLLGLCTDRSGQATAE